MFSIVSLRETKRLLARAAGTTDNASDFMRLLMPLFRPISRISYPSELDNIAYHQSSPVHNGADLISSDELYMRSILV